MSGDGPPLSFSVSMLLASHPLLERVHLAAGAGYTTLESWWPWEMPEPPASEVEALVAALSGEGAVIHLLNLTEGASEFGGRGLAGVPSQADAFGRNATAALGLARRVGTRYLNVLAGNVPPEGRDAALAVLEERLVQLGTPAAAADVGLVVEQLNPIDHPDYLLTDPRAAIDLLARVAERTTADVGMLADVYHLTRSGVDPAAFIDAHHDVIRHVQLADYPGRGRPGSGGIPFRRVIDVLRRTGYRGKVGLEHLPGTGPIPGPDEVWRELTGAGKVST